MTTLLVINTWSRHVRCLNQRMPFSYILSCMVTRLVSYFLALFCLTVYSTDQSQHLFCDMHFYPSHCLNWISSIFVFSMCVFCIFIQICMLVGVIMSNIFIMATTYFIFLRLYRLHKIQINLQSLLDTVYCFLYLSVICFL